MGPVVPSTIREAQAVAGVAMRDGLRAAGRHTNREWRALAAQLLILAVIGISGVHNGM